MFVEVVYKLGIQSMEVVLNTGSLHHQVLGDPRHHLLFYTLQQFFGLQKSMQNNLCLYIIPTIYTFKASKAIQHLFGMQNHSAVLWHGKITAIT